MSFTKIDMNNWERKEIYDFFRGTVMYTTVNMDITRLLHRVKSSGLRLYPALIHCIATVVNTFEDFRYALDEDGNLGRWDVIHPIYTLPRKDNPQLFTMVHTDYEPDFQAFYSRWLDDYARAENCGRLLCDDYRSDFMGITAMPGVHFSSFAFGDAEGKTDFMPFVVIGKYQRENDRVMLPVFGEFVHSVNDGYHISLFFDMLQNRLDGEA